MKIPTLNIHEFEKEEQLKDFYSNSFSEHIRANSDLFHKPHSHDFFLCVFFTSETGKHEIDFNTYAIEPGNFFFLRPGQSISGNSMKFQKAISFFIPRNSMTYIS